MSAPSPSPLFSPPPFSLLPRFSHNTPSLFLDSPAARRPPPPADHPTAAHLRPPTTPPLPTLPTPPLPRDPDSGDPTVAHLRPPPTPPRTPMEPPPNAGDYLPIRDGDTLHAEFVKGSFLETGSVQADVLRGSALRSAFLAGDLLFLGKGQFSVTNARALDAKVDNVEAVKPALQGGHLAGFETVEPIITPRRTGPGGGDERRAQGP